MDPISALTVATACATFIDFGAKFLKLWRTISKEGGLPDLDDLQARTKTLSRIHKRLRDPSPQEEITSKDPRRREIVQHLKLNSKQVRQTANKCCQTADELLAILDKLRSARQTSKLDALKRAIKLIREQRTIERLEKALVQCREAYDSAVLQKLQSSLDLSLLEQRDDFAAVKLQLNDIIGKLQYQERLDAEQLEATKVEMIDAMSKQSLETRQVVSHIGDKIDGFTETSKKAELRGFVLNALFYPDYAARKEQVEPAQEKTYGWAFEAEKVSNNVPWSSFSEWLRSGDGDLYWIHGKAGSGKSTLCSFLVDHSRTRDLLEEWAGNREVYFASFFFWSSGTALQRSIGGALRSLLYQLAIEDDDIVNDIRSNLKISSERVPTLTDTKLKNAIESILGSSTKCYCVFIDGLDEYEGDTSILLTLCNDLRYLQNVKLIVSSRTQQPFQRAFIDCPSLRLQDLNYWDIEAYVSSTLNKNIQDLIPKLTGGADGIFLWAKLVVRAINEAYQNGDNGEMLLNRLERCPRSLESLYDHLFEEMDEMYHRETAFYLLAVLDRPFVQPLHLLLAMKAHGSVPPPAGINPDVAAPVLQDEYLQLVNRINYCTKGLIEVDRRRSCKREWSSSTSHLDYKIPPPIAGVINTPVIDSYVSYMHRTAAEYVAKRLKNSFVSKAVSRGKVALSLLQAQVVLIEDFPMCKEQDFCRNEDMERLHKMTSMASLVVKNYPHQRNEVFNAIEKARHHCSKLEGALRLQGAPGALLPSISIFEHMGLDSTLLYYCIHKDELVDYCRALMYKIGQPGKFLEYLYAYTSAVLSACWEPTEVSEWKPLGVITEMLDVFETRILESCTKNASYTNDTHSVVIGSTVSHIEQFTPNNISTTVVLMLRCLYNFFMVFMLDTFDVDFHILARGRIERLFKKLADILNNSEVYVSCFADAQFFFGTLPRGTENCLINFKYLSQAFLYHIGCTNAVFKKPEQPVRILCYKESRENHQETEEMQNDLPLVIDTLRKSPRKTETETCSTSELIAAAEEKFGFEIRAHLIRNDRGQKESSRLHDLICTTGVFSNHENAFLNGNVRDISLDDFILKDKKPYFLDNFQCLPIIWRKMKRENPQMSGDQALFLSRAFFSCSSEQN